MTEEELMKRETLYKMNDAFDSLQTLKRLHIGEQERSEQTRYLQVTITEMEKVVAYYYVYLVAGRPR
jgi:predicted  nucleic acid-binding Zn ribbon protein